MAELKALSLLNYKDEIESAVQSNELKRFFNDSILHAMIVLNGIIRKERTRDSKPKHICMFCGEFSLFRGETAPRIDLAKFSCNKSDLSVDQMQSWNALNLFEDLQRELTNYLSDKDANFDLILQHGEDTLTTEWFWQLMSEAIQNKRMKIWVLKDHIPLNHFIVSSTSYRLERSDNDKTAVCGFNSPERVETLKTNFSNLIERSEQFSA